MMRTTRARHRWDLAVAVGTIAIALVLLSAPAAGPPPPAGAFMPPLLVCAEPNNLPFLPVDPAADGPSLPFAPRDSTLRDRLDAILARRHG